MRRAGFTLIEMMLVVAIIATLAIISVPGVIRSRTAASESAALSNLKTISNACQLYYISAQAYPPDLITLSNAVPPYIDAQLGAGQKQSYQFVYAQPGPDRFTLNANPIANLLLSGRFFYTDESGIIRVRSDAAAGANDEIVG